MLRIESTQFDIPIGPVINGPILVSLLLLHFGKSVELGTQERSTKATWKANAECKN